MKKKLDEKNKNLILKAQKIFPEVWKWLQREANRETPLEDAIFAIGQLVKRGGVENPWGFLETVIQTKQRKEEIVKREQAWDKRKIQQMQDVADWFKTFLTK